MAAPLSRFRERITILGDTKSPNQVTLGTFKMFSNGNLTSSQVIRPTGISPSRNIERCWDQNNASRQKGGRRAGSRIFRVGGPFVSIKTGVAASAPIGLGTYTSKGNPSFGDPTKNWWEYVGSFMNPDLSHDTISPALYSTAGGSSFLGNPLVPDTTPFESRAWESTKPKIEKAGIANFLYEMREVPDLLHQLSRTLHDTWRAMGGNVRSIDMQPKRVADEFLGLQFGWLPFVGDVVKLCDAVIFSKQYIDEISRGNNVWLKRSATLVDTSNVSRLFRGYTFGCEPSGFNIQGLCKDMTLDGISCKGYYDVYAENTTKVWAEGAFKYYRREFDMSLPYYGSLTAQVNRQITLYGARISPSHIWKALPWSWAADWMSNVGSLIQRHDDELLDGMVAKYLYLMHHTMTRIRSFHLFNFWSGAKAVEFHRQIDVKQRRNADSPYGFVLGKDLSSTQWAIIAALGLSKNVRSS